jgi:hypothetical protein
MKRMVTALLVTLLGVSQGWCGELTLLSEQVHNGEVAVLRWQGAPLSFGVVRFKDKVFYLYPDRAGAIALLPVGLETSEGDYPVLAAMADQDGRTVTTELILSVVRKKAA